MNLTDLIARCVAYAPQLFEGALTTLMLSGVAVVCGFFAGILIHTLSTHGSRPIVWAIKAYISVFRGTPVLAQLLVLYYLPSALGLSLPGIVVAVVGLTLNTAAYQSQILRAGFKSIPQGQIEAAQTFNLTRRQRLWHIEIPQVVALTLPALISEMIDIVKASAVVSVIAVTDLMRVGQQLSSSSYRPLEVYTLTALFYLAITSLLSLAGYCFEQRMMRRKGAPS